MKDGLAPSEWLGDFDEPTYPGGNWEIWVEDDWGETEETLHDYSSSSSSRPSTMIPPPLTPPLDPENEESVPPTLRSGPPPDD